MGCDVSKGEDVEADVKTTASTLGDLDCAFNVAGSLLDSIVTHSEAKILCYENQFWKCDSKYGRRMNASFIAPDFGEEPAKYGRGRAPGKGF